MRTISLHVTEADYAEFKSLAAQEQRPVAELLREAMRSWLGERRKTGASLADLSPVDCGQMLAPFSRDEIADEMYRR